MTNQHKNKRYVAHFDMLGFKAATLRDPDEAWGALSDLRSSMDKMLNTGVKEVSTNEVITYRINAYIFSDQILIFTLSDELADLKAMLVLSSELFKNSLNTRIPLRGGISYGDFFFNTKLQLFCGIPYIKAYEIGENAQWSGIIVDESIADYYHKNLNVMPIIDNGRIIIEWEVPIKPNGKKKSWVINWPAIFKRNFNKKPPISVQDYYQAFESLFGPYEQLRSDVKAKYENTVNFINSNLT